tara:strand:- start:1986 stop:2207 length:222 start_codon:yes stop_codon:yes gene_type:complete
LIKHLVDRPELVDIDMHESKHTVTVEISVHDSDVGKVLGKRGIHAESLRCLFSAIYGKHGKRLLLQVIDPKRR